MKIDPLSGGTAPLDPMALESLQDPGRKAAAPKPKEHSKQMEGVLERLRGLIDQGQPDDDAFSWVGSLLHKVFAHQKKDCLPGFIEARTQEASLRFVADLPSFLEELKDPELRGLFDGLLHGALQVLSRIHGEPGTLPPQARVGDASLNLREALTWLVNTEGSASPIQGATLQLLFEGLGAEAPAGSFAALPQQYGQSMQGESQALSGATVEQMARDKMLKERYLEHMQRFLDLQAEMGDAIPVPEEVSVLDLIREWMKILQALDRDLGKIEKKVQSEKQTSNFVRQPKAGGDPELKLVIM